MDPCKLLPFLALFTAAAFVYFARNGRKGNPKNLPLPPGPATTLFLGNLRDVPVYHQWLTFARWGQKYGDVVHVSVLGTHVIILNSIDGVMELLDKHSIKYSSRPKLPMARELAKWDQWIIGMMDYGPQWRKLRKSFHQSFSANVSLNYQKAQAAEARILLARLLSSDARFRDHMQLWAAATIMRITYGIKLQDLDNEYVELPHRAMTLVSKTLIPGRYLVDSLPILKYYPSWLPGGCFQNEARELERSIRDAALIPFEAVKHALADGRAHILPSAVTEALDALRHCDSEELKEEDEMAAKIVASNAYIGGFDTSFSILTTFVLAMALHPSVQHKAQAELDAVVGRDRLPSFSDRHALPYVESLIKEVWRWNPVAPLDESCVDRERLGEGSCFAGLPRKATEDDEYNGYYIPKGSTVIMNSWAIFHDERLFPEPSVFKPEHFWKDGKLDQELCNIADIIFGAGRRICPGRFSAVQSLFITITSILACFDIVPALDRDGLPIPIEAKMTPLPVSHPEDFRCSFKPRHDRVPELIQQSLKEE